MLGTGEVVVGVDDAHLLDDLSAFTVHQLVTRRLATVILTIRSGESPPDAITAIWKDQHLERLELQPLSLPEITGLVEHVLGGPVDSFSAQRLWQYTQGNALYLRHLLDNEVNAGRMAQRSGVWLWDGQPGSHRRSQSCSRHGSPRCPRPFAMFSTLSPWPSHWTPTFWRRSPMPTRSPRPNHWA